MAGVAEGDRGGPCDVFYTFILRNNLGMKSFQILWKCSQLTSATLDFGNF